MNERLEAVAVISGDWTPWASAQHHMPTAAWQAASKDLCDKIDVEIACDRKPPDTPRRRLARLALRLIRNGAPGRELLRQLDAANADSAAPLSPEQVRSVAVWAAGAAREPRNAA